MAWSIITFGKHEGKTLPQVMFSDPDWFFWAYEEKVFDRKGALKKQADEIYRKATRIIPPQDGLEPLVVEHVIHHPTNKYAHFELVPESRPRHIGSSATFREKLLDMSVPRKIAKYDKLGCKSLVGSLKHYFFNSESARMTRERCEAFFDEPKHFHLP
jgi:hypothetical protein